MTPDSIAALYTRHGLTVTREIVHQHRAMDPSQRPDVKELDGIFRISPAAPSVAEWESQDKARDFRELAFFSDPVTFADALMGWSPYRGADRFHHARAARDDLTYGVSDSEIESPGWWAPRQALILDLAARWEARDGGQRPTYPTCINCGTLVRWIPDGIWAHVRPLSDRKVFACPQADVAHPS